MPKPVTRRTVFTSFCLAAVPIRSAVTQTMSDSPDNPDRLLQQKIVPVDSQFVAVDGWVVPLSTLAQTQTQTQRAK